MNILKRGLSILLAAGMTVSAGAAVAMAEDGYATRGEVCEMLLAAAIVRRREVSHVAPVLIDPALKVGRRIGFGKLVIVHILISVFYFFIEISAITA